MLEDNGLDIAATVTKEDVIEGKGKELMFNTSLSSTHSRWNWPRILLDTEDDGVTDWKYYRLSLWKRRNWSRTWGWFDLKLRRSSWRITSVVAVELNNINKSHSLKKKCKPELMFPKLTDWRQMTIVLMAVGSDRDTMIFALDMLLKGGDNQDFIWYGTTFFTISQ